MKDISKWLILYCFDIVGLATSIVGILHYDKFIVEFSFLILLMFSVILASKLEEWEW